MDKLSRFIDHTILKADAKRSDVKRLCEEAKKYGFASVCVNSCHIEFVAKELEGTDVLPCCVVGFPLGAMLTEGKADETRASVRRGAKEIDMVINIGAAKEGDWELVENDIKAVVDAAGDALVKVIIETCLLTDEEKVLACRAAKKAGAGYVKTSTGFSTGGATLEDVRLMRKTVGAEMGVKASGGIRDYETAVKMIEAGASRLGTSSGVKLVSKD